MLQSHLHKKTGLRAKCPCRSGYEWWKRRKAGLSATVKKESVSSTSCNVQSILEVIEDLVPKKNEEIHGLLNAAGRRERGGLPRILRGTRATSHPIPERLLRQNPWCALLQTSRVLPPSLLQKREPFCNATRTASSGWTLRISLANCSTKTNDQVRYEGALYRRHRPPPINQGMEGGGIPPDGSIREGMGKRRG